MYIPLGGSRHGVLRQLLASVVCFIFVFCWHGAEENLFWWVIGNFIDIVLETIANFIYGIPAVQDFEVCKSFFSLYKTSLYLTLLHLHFK